MICSVAIEYSKQMNTLDFLVEVAQPIATHAARQIVLELLNEKEYHDEDCADPTLYYKFDNDIVIRNDPYERVKIAPLARKLIMKALTDNLKELFVKAISQYVTPFSQAETDEGIPGDVVHNTPVKLRATNDGELLQFVFTADLNLRYEKQPMWQNTNIEVRYVEKPKKD